MKEKLRQALTTRHPTLKPKQVAKAVDKYVAEVIGELAQQLSMGNIEEGEIDFPSDQVRARCGRIDIDKKTHYVLSIMHEHPSTSLVHVTYEGNNIKHEVSKVIFNPRYKKDVLEALQRESLIQELSPTYLDELEAKTNWESRVDVKSLESYIKATRAALAQPGHHENYIETLTTNLLIANTLLSRVRVVDGKTVLLEYWEDTDCGRIYGHGLSLQRVPRQVRNAALGPCHKYDFKASSYALMTSLALQIDPTLKVAALRDYIKYRSIIRRRIAAEVGISEEWMKEIFTAIGFGAKTTDNPYSYVRGKLGADKYNILMMNDEFADIANRFEAVTETIAQHSKGDDFYFMGLTYYQIDPKRKVKRNKAQRLAWIYQRMESVALRKFVELARVKPLLMTHDCVYFKHKLPQPLETDIRCQLNTMFKELNFEHQEVVPIRYNDPRIDAEIAAHKRLIAEDTQFAQNYISPSSTPIPSKVQQVETDEQYEIGRRRQFLIDVERGERGDFAEKDSTYYAHPVFKVRY